MNPIEYFLILLSLLVIIILINKNKIESNKIESNKIESNKIESNKNESQQIETFIGSNFNICDDRDCDCLKLNTAPDGTCTEEKISNIPPIPEYEDHVFYNKKAINNLKYPKKRPHDILIFVGDRMSNKYTGLRSKPPEILENSFKTEYGIYSNDDTTMELYEIYERAVDIISYFDNKTKPYLKYLILNTNNISKDRKIMKSFGIDYKKSPAIYLYNETTKTLDRFLLKKFKLEKQCDILERLIIFIANGDCGLLSYLNFLHDPFYGMKFEYSSKNKKWRPNLFNGKNPIPGGTAMCSLIDIEHVPDEYKCKNIQL